MARADWRSASAYEDLRSLDAPAFAYEFLRRNPDFLSDHSAPARRAGNASTLDADEVEAFAQRWGVRFRSASYIAPRRAPLYGRPGLPSVVTLANAPEDLADPRTSRSIAQSPIGILDNRPKTIRSSNCAAHACACTRSTHLAASPLRPPATRPAFRNPRRRRAPAVARTDRPQAGSRSRHAHARAAQSAHPRAARARWPARGSELSRDRRRFSSTPRQSPSAIGFPTNCAIRPAASSALGFAMMRGGYRRLLLYPYRRRV